VYILADDMNAELGVFGGPAVTPNLDRLASQGLAFPRAFCQISVCSPSRQSFLTGRRPDTHQVWNFIDANPLNTSAVPGYFREHGYLSLGLGKTFHEDAGAWNAGAFWNTSFLPYFNYSTNACPHGSEGGGHCTLPDSKIWDFTLLNHSLAYLSAAASASRASGSPFFFMTGFRDPHAPWAAPPRMAALYDEASIAVAQHPTLGNGTPLIAWSDQLNVMLENGTSFPFAPYSPVPDWVARDQRHAYMAAISYVDEHVGALLARLESEGMAESTIVVFHADHGYATGQHGYWEKKSNFDAIVRVPLIVKAPGRAATAGAKAATFIDLVDVFPTLAALAGLPPPPGVDGQDMSAAFDAPAVVQKGEAFHQ
jgi:iduronate 2-sulfatase